MLSVSKINSLEQDNEQLIKAYNRLNALYNANCDYTNRLELLIQDIKGIATALFMNEWCQKNETARRITLLLQEKLNEDV